MGWLNKLISNACVACASYSSANAKYDTYDMKSRDNSKKISNASQVWMSVDSPADEVDKRQAVMSRP
jgi:hypothetical protein